MVLGNFRPITTLPFLDKVIERLANGQLQRHLTANLLYDPLQSGFREGHSTESVMVALWDQVLGSADQGFSSKLVDLSVAFGTVQHDILLDKLRTVWKHD